MLRATHQGELQIGEVILPCAVLEDGTRVMSQTAVFKAFGRPQRGYKFNRTLNDTRLPAFLDAKNLVPYMDNELIELMQPIVFLSTNRGKRNGYRAEVITAACDVYLSARAEQALIASQHETARKCEMLVRSLSKVGITALIDEATGYQEERERDELHKLLSLYLSGEKLRWAKRFPDEFYRNLYRLLGWNYSPDGKRHRYIGILTNQLVYEYLPPGVLDKLKERNPRDPETGRRKFRHHEFLSEDIGQQKICEIIFFN